MVLQSVLFNKKYYNLSKSINYLKRMGLKYDKVDITNNFYRFRQKTPKKNKKYYTLPIDKGILYILFN